jgi:hypothetical protein
MTWTRLYNSILTLAKVRASLRVRMGLLVKSNLSNKRACNLRKGLAWCTAFNPSYGFCCKPHTIRVEKDRPLGDPFFVWKIHASSDDSVAWL